MKVYIASKSVHGGRWKSMRSDFAEQGLSISSTWIDECEAGQTSDFQDLWKRCIEEAKNCNALIAYHEPGEVWKGAFIEIGAALANGNPVLVVGDPPGSWVNHPLVFRCNTIQEAIWRIGQGTVAIR